MKKFVIANRPVNELTANLDLKDYVGHFNVNLNHPIFKGKLTTEIDLSTLTTLHLTKLSFVGLGGNLTANCVLPLNDLYQTKADLSMFFKDITPIGKMGNLDLSGDAKLTLKLDSLANSQVDFKSQALNHNGISLNNLLLHLQTTNGSGAFNVSSNNATMAFKAAGKINDHFKSTNIQTLDVSYLNTALVTLPAPINFKHYEEIPVLNAENIKIANGRLQISDLRLGNSLHGSVSLKQLPVSILNNFIENIKLKGVIDGTLSISGERTEPEIKGELHAQDVGVINDSRKNDKKSSFKLKFAKLSEQWSGDLVFQDSTSSLLKGSFKLWDDGFFPGQQSQIDLSLKGHLDLSALNVYLWWGDRLKGMTTFDCYVSNSIAKPMFKGELVIKDGVYENAELGTLLKNIQLKTVLSGHQLRITQLQAQDYSKGSLSGSGVMDFSDLSNPTPRIDLQLKQLLLANNDLLTISASGDLHLMKSKRDQLLLKSNLEINSAEIILDDSVKNSKIIKIEDSNISKAEKLRKLNKRQEKENDNFILDIEINIPKTLVVQGYGLDSIWKGKLFVKDSINNPTVTGKIDVNKGKIDVVGKELVIKDSSVEFTKEGKEIVPLLNIKASKVIRDVEAFIRVEGKATHPNIDFISIPSLSREEVISLILFGKPLSSVTAAQSLQLATAMASLKAGGGGKGFLEKLSSTFGLDDLGINSMSSGSDDHQEEATSGYALRAGKQLNDKIYVAVDQGVKDDISTKIIMEIDATKNTKINLEGGSRSNSIGYTWEKRY